MRTARTAQPPAQHLQTYESLCFLFSSRRRHTRFDCDWSSDVCSSDLMESAALAALGVGLEVDEVDESIDPVEADEDVSGEGFTVPKGGIVGVHQVARAFHEGKEVAHLELTIALGAPDPRDEIELVGDPGLKCVIPGGVPGDRATAWSVAHAVPLVAGAEPGLITVLDLPAGR